MEEQPVALLTVIDLISAVFVAIRLATIICSPKSWVMHLRYGVSPQPAQAPLNSNRGCANWLFLTLAFLSMRLSL